MNIRAIVGVVAAPLVIPLVMAVIWVTLVPYLPVTAVGQQYQYGSMVTDRLHEGLGIGVFAMVVCYVVTLLGAVPAHVWLVRRGYSRWWMYVALGACLGIATLSIFAFPQFIWDPFARPLAPLIFLAGLVAACGVSTALLFWLIAVRTWWAATSAELRSTPIDKMRLHRQA